MSLCVGSHGFGRLNLASRCMSSLGTLTYLLRLTSPVLLQTDDINVKLNQGVDEGTAGITNPFKAAFKKSNLVLDTFPGADELAKTKKPEPVAAATDEIKIEIQEIKREWNGFSA